MMAEQTLNLSFLEFSMKVLCDSFNSTMVDNGFNREESNNSVSAVDVIKHYYTAPLGPLVPVQMMCTRMGTQVMVHTTIILPDSNQSCLANCSFSLEKYCKKNNNNSVTECSSFVLCYERELRNSFTTKIIHKLLTELRRALNLPEKGTLTSLSHEIKLLVMCLLDVRSLLCVSEVNSEFYLLSQDSQLWKKMYLKHLCNGNSLLLPVDDKTMSWKTRYMKQYKLLNQVRLKLPNPLIKQQYYPEQQPCYPGVAGVPFFPSPDIFTPMPLTVPYLNNDNTQIQHLLRLRQRLSSINPLIDWQYNEDITD